MLITEKYPAVVATRFRLQTRTIVKVDGKDKQIWDINCKSKIDEGKKLQLSSYVEEMNSIDCDIHFEIDQEATEEAQAYLAEKLSKKNEKDKYSHLTAHEAIDKLANVLSERAGGNEGDKTENVQDSELITKHNELFGKDPMPTMKNENLETKIKTELDRIAKYGELINTAQEAVTAEKFQEAIDAYNEALGLATDKADKAQISDDIKELEAKIEE